LFIVCEDHVIVEPVTLPLGDVDTTLKPVGTEATIDLPVASVVALGLVTLNTHVPCSPMERLGDSEVRLTEREGIVIAEEFKDTEPTAALITPPEIAEQSGFALKLFDNVPPFALIVSPVHVSV